VRNNKSYLIERVPIAVTQKQDKCKGAQKHTRGKVNIASVWDGNSYKKRRLLAPFLEFFAVSRILRRLLATQHAETLVEFVDTTTSVNNALLASVERVTL
jgi:hypothetical protein